MLEVVNDTKFIDVDITSLLQSGKAVAFYAGYVGLKTRMALRYPEADVWYTERNGDPIAMLVPHGTPLDQLPNTVCGYWVFEWIDPDAEFGTGFRPCR